MPAGRRSASAIAAVMEAFSERGFVRRGARICESQMAALRVGFTEALKRYFLGKPPSGYFGGIAAYDDMHRACNVASNEASRAGGVGHVTNRLQKTTAAQLSRSALGAWLPLRGRLWRGTRLLRVVLPACQVQV